MSVFSIRAERVVSLLLHRRGKAQSFFFSFFNPKDYLGLFGSICLQFGSLWWISALNSSKKPHPSEVGSKEALKQFNSVHSNRPKCFRAAASDPGVDLDVHLNTSSRRGNFRTCVFLLLPDL